jgi:hypothetical protein
MCPTVESGDPSGLFYFLLSAILVFVRWFMKDHTNDSMMHLLKKRSRTRPQPWYLDRRNHQDNLRVFQRASGKANEKIPSSIERNPKPGSSVSRLLVLRQSIHQLVPKKAIIIKSRRVGINQYNGASLCFLNQSFFCSFRFAD